MKFYYIYILHNAQKNFIYIGFSEDLKTRITTHNKGENKSTKSYIPLELIHYEAYKDIKDAKRRELYLKSNKGRTTLMTMLKEYFGKSSPKSRYSEAMRRISKTKGILAPQQNYLAYSDNPLIWPRVDDRTYLISCNSK